MIRYGWLLAAILPWAADAELTGVPCADLDAQEAPLASTYPYQDWRCQDLVVPGTNYRLRVRWNRPGLASQASALWLAGGNGSKAQAEIDLGVAGAPDPRPIRDRLDQDHAIRSIEVQFLTAPDSLAPYDVAGGYWAPPRRGFLKPAQAYLAVVDYLRAPAVDLIQGEWLTQVASSNGATIIAFALAYLGAERYFDRIVFVSGPFLGDTYRECADPGFVAYTGINDNVSGKETGAGIRNMISFVNGWTDCADPALDFTRRSALDAGAQRDFPNTEIAVIMGADDEFGPWILRSNEYWFDSITARQQWRSVVPNTNHDAFTASAASAELIYSATHTAPGAMSPGLFTIGGRDIYYSNGSHYCYFPTMEVYFRLTGRTDIVGVPDYPAVPAGLIFAGNCGA
jgi:hypothetical protein